MAKQKPSGWLDKYSDNVAASDATRTLPALNYRSVEDSARIEREKELARRKTSVGPQSKPSVAMKQAAEERYAQQKRNEKYKKAAEYAQVIGGGLEVAAPFTGPLAPIIGGAGTITSAGSSAYLSGRDVADENYGSALMNAGFGGLGIAGYTPAARAANVGGVNVAKAANTADYVSDVASTYNAYDDYGSNYAQRIQNIRQHVTEDELRDITRRSTIGNNPRTHVMGMPMPSNITPNPTGGLFGMTAEQTNSAWANYNPLDLSSLMTSTSLRGRLDQRIQSALGMNSPRNLITSSRPRQSLLQSLGESIYTGLGGSRRSHNQYVPFSQLVAEQNAGRGMTNISGFGNEQLLANDALINKDVVAKMAPEEFASTVYKPSGEVAPYQHMYDPLPGVYGMSPSQYADRFNQNLDLLNDIISKQNKTGVDYRVTGLDENGMLTFHTPKQIKRWQDDPFNIQVLEGLEKLKNDPVELQKRLQATGQTLEDFDRILNSFKEADEIIPEGNRRWATRIIPGEFRGEIQDIPNAEYYKSIPGLNMASSSQGVFSDTVTRRGSGAYEAINEYLKRLDLGRVKPGFNSQSDSSRPLWENAIKKGKAFGYYSNPHTVYGAMKTVAPVIGAGAVASEFIDQKKNGGWLEKYNDGGPVQPNYNDSNASAGPGFEGDGYSNVGRNYSPAWGGQFQDGGELANVTVKGKRQPIVVTNPKDPRLKAYQDSLSLFNESKNTEDKVSKIFAKAYKRVGFDKSTIDKTLYRGKDIILNPKKYTKEQEHEVGPRVKNYNKKGLYSSSVPDREYLGTPEYPATIQNLIKYNKEDIKYYTPYLNSLDEDINGLTAKERIELANITNASLQKQNNIIKRTGYNPTYFIPNAERTPNLIFKKPTQPVVYRPEPTPQSTIDFMEGNYAQEPVIETPQASAYGEVVDPRTGYTHMTRQGSAMYPIVGQNVPEMAMGGSIGGATQGIPGATGFMYARVSGSTPSKGEGRNKVYKTDASAENGKEMKFYQEGLDFKPKSISKNGSKVIKDDRGQWAHPGEITEIGSNQITMRGVPYPVMGISDTGDMQMMYPDEDYVYDGESVTEIPMMAQGGQLTKLDQLTNFTNYNTKQPGGWLDKYQ